MMSNECEEAKMTQIRINSSRQPTMETSFDWIIRREDDLRERNAQIQRLKDGNAVLKDGLAALKATPKELPDIECTVSIECAKAKYGCMVVNGGSNTVYSNETNRGESCRGFACYHPRYRYGE
eukprot:578684_1